MIAVLVIDEQQIDYRKNENEWRLSECDAIIQYVAWLLYDAITIFAKYSQKVIELIDKLKYVGGAIAQVQVRSPIA